MVHVGDALDVLPTMEPGSVDLIVTSPPYADARDYGGPPPAEYVDWWMPFARAMARVMAEHASLVVVIKERTQDGERHTYVLDLIRAMRADGWRWIDEYCWRKTNPMPGAWPSRLKDGFERCLHFSPTVRPRFRPEHASRPSVRTAAAIRRNRRYQARQRTRAGEARSEGGFRVVPGRSERLGLVRPDNVIESATVAPSGGPRHPAAFPEAIPAFFVALMSDPGDLVLDPFCGSGTTVRVAESMGRRGVGIDLHQWAPPDDQLELA